MPNYKVVDADQLDALLTDMADAIREKTLENDIIPSEDMAEKIRGLNSFFTLDASGEVIAVQDSAASQLYGLNIYGKTTQDGTPSVESPVELVSAGNGGTLNVSIYGKNLFDESYLLKASGWTVEDGIYSGLNKDQRSNIKNNQPIRFRQNTQYFFSLYAAVTARSNNSRIMIQYTDGTADNLYVREYTELTYMECLTRIGKTVSGISIEYGSNEVIYLRDVFVCVASENNAYEPYKGTQVLTVPTPGGLAGIPVTSGGNYTDRNGQQWICDEVDFARGVFIQRIKKIEEYNMTVIHGQHMSTTGKLTNGATVIWALPDPIETDLSAEQLAAYAALYTYYPSTTIMNDADVEMRVCYKADTDKFVEGKKDAVSTAELYNAYQQGVNSI